MKLYAKLANPLRMGPCVRLKFVNAKFVQISRLFQLFALTLQLLISSQLKMRVKIHHEGTGILLVGAVIVVAVCLPLWLCCKVIAIPIALTAVMGCLYLFLIIICQ